LGRCSADRRGEALHEPELEGESQQEAGPREGPEVQIIASSVLEADLAWLSVCMGVPWMHGFVQGLEGARGALGATVGEPGLRSSHETRVGFIWVALRQAFGQPD